jgi:hypothetical protein
MRTQCSVCLRKISTGKYCVYHNQALDNLKQHYKTWVEAYGIISWNDFLKKLLNMTETGYWIKEVAIVELKN